MFSDSTIRHEGGKAMTIGEWIALAGVVVAIVGVIFGDNLWEQITEQPQTSSLPVSYVFVPIQQWSNPPPRTSNGMVTISAGKFFMGCNNNTDSECQENEQPGRYIYLDTFQIDSTEVTVDAYSVCVNAGKCTAPGAESNNCNWGKLEKGNHPVNCVDWNQASTFCTWAGKQLPTEAQWEKAARGVDGRKYPWGNETASCDYAVMDDGGNGCGTGSTMPVGSKLSGASPYGVLDMSGNVWEWTADWYDSDDYMAPHNLGSMRVNRGGSLNGESTLLRASSRGSGAPDRASSGIGLRCAMDSSP